ncbi:MAG: cell division protein ZapA [Lachnospiraceae bacterium]|nr:cell division protein ZapA [Lachnospiraceae bacterium]MDY5742005.1 cell division protein ZapA [Lachnospiraceae bacterium]
MSSKNMKEVLIGGKIYRLGGYESDEYLEKVAAYLNNKLIQLEKLGGLSRLSVDLKNLQVQINVCDDYFKAKKQAEVFEEEMNLRERELYDLKHELVTLQISLEKKEKEVERLSQERDKLRQKIIELGE